MSGTAMTASMKEWNMPTQTAGARHEELASDAGTVAILRALEPEIRNEFAILSSGLALLEDPSAGAEAYTMHAQTARHSVKRLGALFDATMAILVAARIEV